MQKTIRNAIAGVTLSAALVIGGAVFAPAANAAGARPSAMTSSEARTVELDEITPAQVDEAIAEARAMGRVKQQTEHTDGSVTTSLDLGDGFLVDLVQTNEQTRLGAGKDSKGTYVSFNSFDQDAIINGATWGIGAGLCAVSAGTFCVVAGAILLAASLAISANTGSKCRGGKSLRVYPFAGGRVAPRCV